MNAPTSSEAADPRERLLYRIATSLERGDFVKLVLSKPLERDRPQGERVSVRPLALRGVPRLSFVHSHATRDVTKNLPVDAGLDAIRELLVSSYAHAHAYGVGEELHWLISRKGQQTLRSVARASGPDAPAAPVPHDRAKQRWVALDRPFLAALGVTDARGTLVPAMARKWKQINKFVEIVDHALAASALAGRRGLKVVDFGAGKGYLTFALHDHLAHALQLAPEVVGVELRDDMVRLCNDAARRVGAVGLRFEHGDVRTRAPERVDVMIALHACDTATDHAIHAGIRAGADVIVCAPCCHKEVRPQMRMPALLRPMLQHGVHLGQQAEMVTDSLRALLLEVEGYATQVFEFVALEHTSKNKMILATRRAVPAAASEARAQVAALKDYYGIGEQSLERLLQADAQAVAAASSTAAAKRSMSSSSL
ncbi:MAG: SAM-dependent methyltransferase [Proteobacteria bacterium]|nr:SAM-dependent methyltransferase [Pseudomonadota bacterium]